MGSLCYWLVHVPLQIAGTILDSYARGMYTYNHVWFSGMHPSKECNRVHSVLTVHIWEFCQVSPGPLARSACGPGYEASGCVAKMFAMEMKSTGLCVSQGLSFR